MAITQKTLPDYIQVGLQELSLKTSVSIDVLTKEFEERFADSWIQEDPQFKTDEDKLRYCIGSMIARYTSQAPVSEHNIITLGFEGKRLTKNSNTLRRVLFVLDLEKLGPKKRRLSVKEGMVDIINEISMFTRYDKVLLGSFQSGDLSADNRTRFENPISIGEVSKIQKLFEHLGVKRTTIKDTPQNLAKLQGQYTDSLDWRIIRAFIINSNTGTRKDDQTTWGQYFINDGSVKDEAVQPDGTVIRPGLSAWVAPELMTYAQDSECDFVGILTQDKESKQISMNVACIIPIHAREVQRS